MKNISEVAVIGGINCDIIGKSFEKTIPATSNPGSIITIPGGVTGNIARNLAQLSVKTSIFSSVGKDNYGDLLLEELKNEKINIDHILLSDNSTTGIYLAILNNDGEMDLALSDMKVMEEINTDYLESKSSILKNTKFIICDANIDKSSILYLIRLAKQNKIPICIEPVSISKSKKLIGLLKDVDIITPNRDELFSLAKMSYDDKNIEKASSILLKQGVKNIVLTLGSEGLLLINNKTIKHFPSFPAEIKNVTGAGDSLTAGLVYGLIKHENIEKACLYGLAAASITISSESTVSKELNIETLSEKVSKYCF